jgi:hypothetical protein
VSSEPGAGHLDETWSSKQSEKVYYNRYDSAHPDDCAADEILVIERSGHTGWEYGCDYTSIKEMHAKFAATAKGRKIEGWTPAVRIMARCEGEGHKWRERLIMIYSEGILAIQEEMRTPRINPRAPVRSWNE